MPMRATDSHKFDEREFNEVMTKALDYLNAIASVKEAAPETLPFPKAQRDSMRGHFEALDGALQRAAAVVETDD